MCGNRVFLAVVFLGVMALVAIAMPTAGVLAADISPEDRMGSPRAAWDAAYEPTNLAELRAFYAKDRADLASSPRAAWDGAYEPTSLAELRAFYAKDEVVSRWSPPIRARSGRGPY